jgi:hypothetical protein
MPNWIDFFHTDLMLQTNKRAESQVLIAEGVVVVVA